MAFAGHYICYSILVTGPQICFSDRHLSFFSLIIAIIGFNLLAKYLSFFLASANQVEKNYAY